MDPSKQPVYFFFFIRQVGACKMAAEETIDRKTEVLLVTAAAWPPRHRSTSSVDLVAAEASTTTSGCLTTPTGVLKFGPHGFGSEPEIFFKFLKTDFYIGQLTLNFNTD
jgi:hypothetical protein